jgi:uncharacterized repeat protein (TIGR03803 family)
MSGGPFGTVYKLDTNDSLTVYHGFTGRSDGDTPNGNLIADHAGNLYGTARGGGDLKCGGCGVVFELVKSRNFKVLYRFHGGKDGKMPMSPLVLDGQGNLYGATLQGGLANKCGEFGLYSCGVLFRLDKHGKETVLYRFTGKNDGSSPSGLVQDGKGNLYGVTTFGGDFSCQGSGCGTVFRLDKSGKLTILHTFTAPDGENPTGPLLLDASGNLYGSATAGGASGWGTVFKMDKSGKETVLYNFTGGSDGGNPEGRLSRDAEGRLYGTTGSAGSGQYGVVFQLDTTGKETVLYSFTGGSDGGYPDGGVIRDPNGNLYGTANNVYPGVLFMITP